MWKWQLSCCLPFGRVWLIDCVQLAGVSDCGAFKRTPPNQRKRGRSAHTCPGLIICNYNIRHHQDQTHVYANCASRPAPASTPLAVYREYVVWRFIFVDRRATFRYEELITAQALCRYQIDLKMHNEYALNGVHLFIIILYSTLSQIYNRKFERSFWMPRAEMHSVFSFVWIKFESVNRNPNLWLFATVCVPGHVPVFP